MKRNLIVINGFTDLHSHLREPGFSYKETIKTATMSAVAGGYTAICSMPNINPVQDSEENLKLQIEIIKKEAKCDVHPFMSITKNIENDSLSDFRNVFKKDPKLFVGITNDGNSVENEGIMEQAFKIAAENNILIASHCEFKKFYPNSKAEYEYLERDLKLLEKYRCKYHVQHVSCKESIDLIKRAKLKGLSVTCEVTPHHLLLCEEYINYKDIENSGAFKVSPPIRSYEDMKILQNSVADGTIDAIATDHAPHAEFEKNRGFELSLNGVVSLEFSFALLYTELVLKLGILNLDKLLSLFTDGPNQVINMENRKNDLVFVDLDEKWCIEPDNFYTKGRSTPFAGKNVYGKVSSLIKDGNIIFKDGGFLN
ncbi:MAG: dihydroorotase [Candidatus Improbicoccus pseudotrichonymphae]|uniref:Dihydroorotase n=1 Tax=Candidatus Improbicoccus pseudotrichonymphae TaxID=3033792 RepID=A0AA48HV59_9FIRM|nr:MAG: dihydroorotase [Candidatus Improbicoccus pseudotrichonymphae]